MKAIKIVGAVFFGFAGAAQAADGPTFTRDIAPIVWNNCVVCHREGESAPFNLTSYNDVKKRGKQVAQITHARTMPPWKAEAGFGEFDGERRLTDAQIALIEKWVGAGAPEGDANLLPPLPKFTEGWQLGKPDVIVKMDQEYEIPAEGRDVFRCFVLPLEIPAGKYVKAVEYRPNNRRATHHALLFLDATGAARKLDAADAGPGYAAMGGVGFVPSGGMGGWSPGATPHPMPPGVARTVKAGTDLVIQTHFHPTGKKETEQAQVGIYLTEEAPKRYMSNLPLGLRSPMDIAPGVMNYKVTDSMTLPVDLEVPGVTPHAHYLCKDMRVWATLPNGEKKWLIWIKDWDFNWQDQYVFKDPIKLPKGTKIEMEYTYDNTADNPRNPSNPPKRVRRGEQTTDEMGITFVPVVVDTTAQLDIVQKARREHFMGKLLGLGFGGGEKAK